MNSLNPLVNESFGQLDRWALELLGQQAIENYASKNDVNRLKRGAERRLAGDVGLVADGKEEVRGKSKQMSLPFGDQAPVGSGSSGPTPGGQLQSGGQATKAATRTTYTVASEVGHIHVFDETTGRPVKGKIPGEQFDAWMNQRFQDNPDAARSFAKRNNLIQDAQGRWLVPVQRDTAALQQLIPGKAAETPVAGSVFDSVSRSSWMLPAIGGGMGFLGGGVVGGIGGMVMGFLGAKALKSAAAGQTTGSLALMSPGLAGIGGGGGIGGYGTAALAGMAGGGGIQTAFAAVEGTAYYAKKQMRAYAEVMQDSQLIALINNPGIPIEDLIFMFMAHMSDKYERKLRDKMEEAARAEQRQTMNERERDETRRRAAMVQATAAAAGAGAGLLGGVANMLTGGAISQTAMAVGQMQASQIQAQGEANIMMRNALQGHTKSSTILMNEVQVLMQKWQRLNELMSNLLKSLHDMAMTPIRNLK